ncbi:hypothetical protein ACFPPD_02405 [Cohnella suwonensis]|uniref:Uncharacterized protein n=1 Tax=Cohnella suwonensis TaxID=696072 RepID=A0ABW0LSJ2_9BACL
MNFHEHDLRILSAERHEQWERRIRDASDRKAAKREKAEGKRRASEPKNEKEGCSKAPSLSIHGLR